MCKHFPEAQVSVRTSCCRKFYDCPQCHDEAEDHSLRRTVEMALICKKCKKAFRKNLADFDAETDSFCPHCDNEFVLSSATASKPTKAATQSLPNPLAGLDARMIREGDVNDEDFGLEKDSTTRLG